MLIQQKPPKDSTHYRGLPVRIIKHNPTFHQTEFEKHFKQEYNHRKRSISKN